MCVRGGIPHRNTPGGSLLFTPEDIRQALGEQSQNTTQPTWVYYTRSSSGNRNSINNQIKTLQQQYPTHNPIIIKDNASGLNENRKGLKRLLDLADQHDITDIAITNKDRLTRFGYKYIERYLTKQGIKIHVANQKRDQTAEQELAKARTEKMQAIQTKVLAAIKEVGNAGQYVYVMDISSGIPYISETLSTDVTAMVKTKLGLK